MPTCQTMKHSFYAGQCRWQVRLHWHCLQILTEVVCFFQKFNKIICAGLEDIRKDTELSRPSTRSDQIQLHKVNSKESISISSMFDWEDLIKTRFSFFFIAIFLYLSYEIDYFNCFGISFFESIFINLFFNSFDLQECLMNKCRVSSFTRWCVP